MLKLYIIRINFLFSPGITGATMQLDKNGDSEGNFSVLALTNVLANNNYNINNTIVIKNFTCTYQMRQVGQFQQGEFPVSEFTSNSMFVIPQQLYNSK